MARASKWNSTKRKKLLTMLSNGIAEQEIRRELSVEGKPMSAAEFAQQLKMAMVESGQIKQSVRAKTADRPATYEVTAKGRLTLNDFSDITGFPTGMKFTLEKPRGKSKAWRVVPFEDNGEE